MASLLSHILSSNDKNGQIESLFKGIQEEFDTLSSKLDKILTNISNQNEKLDIIESRLGALENVVSKLSMQKDDIKREYKDLSVNDNTDSKSVKDKKVNQDKKEKVQKVVCKRTFYAMGEGDKYLSEVPDEYKTEAPFVATVNGNKGEVQFNKMCVSQCLPKAESDLFPFFEYEIISTNPSSVIADNTAEIEWNGQKWVMDKLIKLKFE